MKDNRATGLKLAKKLGAVETMQAIRDKNLSYDEIYKIAVKEVGLDKFTSAILEEDPSWSEQALQYIPDLGKQTDAVAERASEMYADRIIAENDTNGFASGLAGLQKVGTVILERLDPMLFVCKYTLCWQNTPDGPVYPQAAIPDAQKWVWSLAHDPNYSHLRQQRFRPSEWDGRAGLSIQNGAIIWPLVSITCGKWHELKQFSFIADRSGSSIGYVFTKGTADNPEFSGYQ